MGFRVFYGIFLSEIFVISDYYYYDLLTSDKGHWDITNSGGQYSFTENGLYLYSNQGAEITFILDISLLSHYSMEAQIYSLNTSYPYHTIDIVSGIGIQNYPQGLCIYNSGVSSDVFGNQRIVANDIVKIVVENGMGSVYINDTLIGSNQVEASPKIFKLSACCNRNMTIKNLKIKRLQQ